MPCRRIPLSPGHRHGHHGDVELERHPGEWVIGIDHHEAGLFVDLGDHHAVKAGALFASQPRTPLGRAAASGR